MGGVGGLPPTDGPQEAPPPRSLSAAEGGSFEGEGAAGGGGVSPLPWHQVHVKWAGVSGWVGLVFFLMSGL
jgi:hypothetical protein